MTEVSQWNQPIVEEFRSNEGRIGGPFDGLPMLLLHDVGAKSGKEYIHPLAYQVVGDGYAIFGSKGGAPVNPAWVSNLVANPEVEIEVGTDTFKVRARLLEGDERETIWSKQKVDRPGFADYDAKVKGIRQIPIFLLERV
jgi:deazaflavin-dependent oxidoreductase (nitroreductase family)